MQRTDLLQLSDDDLAALSTRGKVKEARRDLDDPAISLTLDEQPDGSLRVSGDGRVTDLAAGDPVRRGRCSCAAVSVCKHLLRLVLLYQRQCAVPPPAAEAWDPGLIPDAELTKHFRPQALTKARQVFDAGVLAEVVRSTRPLARFLVPGGQVRFLVPGDLRYTRCDCGKPAPCDHVPLAVWAFRLLDPGKRGGVVLAGASPPADEELLAAFEQVAADVAGQGVAGASAAWAERLTRLADRGDGADLVWPSAVVRDLLQQHDAYARHDARFDPAQVADLVGELVLRLDAVRHASHAVPALLVRGPSRDREDKLGASELWGLGCVVTIGRKGVTLAAYLYDTRTSAVFTLTKAVADRELTDDNPGRSFAALGGHVAVQGTSFADVGVGVVQLPSARRTAAGELLPGRGNVVVQHQTRLNWEDVQPPVLAEEFAEIADRLSSLPPPSLRPRRLGEDFHVLRVEQITDSRFDAAGHRVEATLVDRAGAVATLRHPWTTRGRLGAEALLARLTAVETPRFVAGLVRRSPGGLVVEPTCLVWDEGGKRRTLQPWVADAVVQTPVAPPTVFAKAADPLLDFLHQVQGDLGELLLLGLTRADVPMAKRLGELTQRAEATGFVRLADRLSRLTRALEDKARTLRWDATAATALVLELTALVRLAGEVA